MSRAIKMTRKNGFVSARPVTPYSIINLCSHQQRAGIAHRGVEHESKSLMIADQLFEGMIGTFTSPIKGFKTPGQALGSAGA
jgi:hypothetical protein